MVRVYVKVGESHQGSASICVLIRPDITPGLLAIRPFHTTLIGEDRLERASIQRDRIYGWAAGE